MRAAVIKAYNCLDYRTILVKQTSDPLPLTLRGVWELLSAAGRELLWGLPAVVHEIDTWRARAEAIPDRPLREDALDSITHKRDHIEGAALFWVLPRHRNRELLRLLVAFQTMWDYLDNITERYTSRANSGQLHLALIEALDPDAPMSYYYRHHPWEDDGGYLRELVETCRAGCVALPAYSRVRPHVLAGVARFAFVQGINHDRDPERRDATLRVWAERHSPKECELVWFELAAAASGFMPHVLLTLAADVSCAEYDIAETLKAYFPSVALLVTMLDSYVDQIDDALSGNHSYIAHYGDADVAMERLRAISDQAAREARALRNGHRHATIIACMIAMHLTRDRAYTPGMRPRTRTIVNAGGSLTRLLLPFIRVWRVAYLKRAYTDVKQQTRSAERGALPPGSHLPAAVQTLNIWMSPLTCLERCRSRYGSRFTINVTSRSPLVFLCDPDDMKAIMSAPADVLYPGEGASTVEPLVGQGSFMLLDEEAHLDGRKVILPLLRAKAVAQHAELVGEISQRAVASWPRGIPFALHPRLRALTLETALRTAFGVSERISEQRFYELHKRLLAMLSVTGSAAFPEPLLRHGPGRQRWRRFLRERAEIDDLIYDIIESRGNSEDSASNLLDTLLHARNADGSPMSQQQVRDNLMSILLAGHETTAAQLAWTFQLLAHNPAVLDKLIEEIDANADAEYLTATIQEVQRHRPVFLFAIPRAVKQPIDIGGWVYRPPAYLLGCIYLLHHDPTLFPDPQTFRPERFMEGPSAGHTWLPWGGGHKRCPGLHLATLEMKTVLRTVLATMTVRPAAKSIEHAYWRSVIVVPHAGSRIVLNRRH